MLLSNSYSIFVFYPSMRPHVWEKKVIFNVRIFLSFRLIAPHSLSLSSIARLMTWERAFIASRIRRKTNEEKKEKAFFTDCHLGRGGSLAQLHLIVWRRVCCCICTRFLSAAKPTDQGEESVILVVVGGEFFSFPCTVLWGVKRQKLCFKRGFKKA